MFTRDQIEEIKKKLIMLGTKDTQFPDAHKLNGEEIVAIVQDGENKKIPLSSIINDDFINVSKDTTEILTLSTAVSKIDTNNRKLGQVITFKDSANSWAIRQFTGSSLDNWNDISLWKSISGIDELKSQVETNAEDISVLSDEIERHDASILNLNTDVSKLKDKDIETSSSLSELTTRVDTLKSQADTNTSNISSINTEVSTLQSKVDENTTSISRINTELDNKNDEIAQINNTLAEHTESINAKITTDRIEDGAVTSEKIATSAFDSTLSVSGKIAPADVVGGKLSELDGEISGVENFIIGEYRRYNTDVSARLTANGEVVSQNYYHIACFQVEAGKRYKIQTFDKKEGFVAFFNATPSVGTTGNVFARHAESASEVYSYFNYTATANGYIGIGYYNFDRANEQKIAEYISVFEIANKVVPLENIPSRVQTLENKLLEVTLDKNDFIIGNITISTSGWDYSVSTSRVSTKQGFTLKLVKGDVIKLSDYTDARYYLGWKLPDGTYKVKGWNTADYIVEDDGEYVILISNRTEVAQDSVDALFNMLTIERVSYEDVKNIAESNNRTIKGVIGVIPMIAEVSASTENHFFFENYPREANPFKYKAIVRNGESISFSIISILNRFSSVGWVLFGIDMYGIKTQIESRYSNRKFTYVADKDYISFEFNILTKNTTTDYGEIVFKANLDNWRMQVTNSVKYLSKASVHDSLMPTIHGATMQYPQNSINLYKLAGENGILVWECDVRPCLDGYVLSHDNDLYQLALTSAGEPISQGEWLCSQKTIAELQTLKTGILKGTSTIVAGFENTTITTFKEYINLCKIYRAVALVEIKFSASQQQCRDLYDIVASAGMLNNTIWLLYENQDQHAQYLFTIDENINIMYCGEYLSQEIVTKVASYKNANNVCGVDYYASSYTEDLIASCGDNRLIMGTWGVSTSRESVAKYVAKGLTLITQDEMDNPLIYLR